MRYTANESRFIEYLDVIAGSCKLRNQFIRLWRTITLEHAVVHSKIKEENKELLRIKIKELDL